MGTGRDHSDIQVEAGGSMCFGYYSPLHLHAIYHVDVQRRVVSSEAYSSGDLSPNHCGEETEASEHQ